MIMNEFKGTPGPWQTAKPRVKQNGLFVEIDIQSTITATLICTVKKDIGFTTAEDVERNAHLISKAPEMLAMLEEFLTVTYTGCSKKELDQLRVKADKLIKQATTI
jgi:hypothetical protein